MKVHSLEGLLVEELKDLYSAENQIIKALPRMVKTATSPDLAAGFEEHLEQTRCHVERLEQICKQMGVTPKGKKCKGLEGILEEGKEIMSLDAEGAVIDAGLIAAAQKVEHYEVAGYGPARAWAEQLGLGDAVRLLQETLDEEKATDQKLTDLAEQMVNQDAEVAVSGNGRSNGRSRQKVGTRR
jgi:ferritin-like metal-binding protein YciE